MTANDHPQSVCSFRDYHVNGQFGWLSSHFTEKSRKTRADLEKVHSVPICLCHHNTQEHVTIWTRKCTRPGYTNSRNRTEISKYGSYTDKAEADDTT